MKAIENATGIQDMISLQRIDENPNQPRKSFDNDELVSLADSIKTHGVLQPLVVRQVGDRYQLIAGERRLRAARVVGLGEIPVTVVNFNDQQVLEAALVENIHRTDLNPIEKAQGFKDYLTRFSMTHDQLAQRVGIARTTITHLLSLLELPTEVQNAVRTGSLTTGHAKLLRGISDSDRQVALCREVISRGLSVNALDQFIKQPAAVEKEPSGSMERVKVEKTAHVQSLENDLRQRLAVKIEIKLKDRDKGQVILNFESNDDFERLVGALMK